MAFQDAICWSIHGAEVLIGQGSTVRIICSYLFFTSSLVVYLCNLQGTFPSKQHLENNQTAIHICRQNRPCPPSPTFSSQSTQHQTYLAIYPELLNAAISQPDIMRVSPSLPPTKPTTQYPISNISLDNRPPKRRPHQHRGPRLHNRKPTPPTPKPTPQLPELGS